MSPARSDDRSSLEPATIYRDLRRQALNVTPEILGRTAADLSILCVLMETTYANGTATLAAFADGTSSLYLSTGAGLLGAGSHAAVKRANRALLAQAQRSRRLLRTTRHAPLPPIGSVRFYVKTPQGLLTAERAEVHLGRQQSSLSPLFNAAHRVVTQIRLTEVARRN